MCVYTLVIAVLKIHFVGDNGSRVCYKADFIVFSTRQWRLSALFPLSYSQHNVLVLSSYKPIDKMYVTHIKLNHSRNVCRLHYLNRAEACSMACINRYNNIISCSPSSADFCGRGELQVHIASKELLHFYTLKRSALLICWYIYTWYQDPVSLFIFHRMNQQHNGKRAVFTATHANNTPKFNPILEWMSKRMVLDASTTRACQRSQGTQVDATRTYGCELARHNPNRRSEVLTQLHKRTLRRLL